MHLPIANNLASRDGTTAKDEGGRNVVIETDGEASVCLKRPGALSLGAVGTGVGQLLACHGNNLKAVIGNALADVSISGGAASVDSSQALNPVIADKPFISQMAIKSTGEKITVIKTAHEAWVYK